jgi:hypothetical protein
MSRFIWDQQDEDEVFQVCQQLHEDLRKFSENTNVHTILRAYCRMLAWLAIDQLGTLKPGVDPQEACISLHRKIAEALADTVQRIGYKPEEWN